MVHGRAGVRTTRAVHHDLIHEQLGYSLHGTVRCLRGSQQFETVSSAEQFTSLTRACDVLVKVLLVLVSHFILPRHLGS